MKKIFSAIAALVSCAVMLTACGGGDPASGDQNGTASVSSENSSEAADGNSAGNPGSNPDSSKNEEHSEENESEGNEADSSEAESDNSGDAEQENIPSFVPEEEISFDDDEEEENYSEPENDAVSGSAFDSLKQFAETGLSSVPYESIGFKNSNTYDLLKNFDSERSLHLEVSDTSTDSLLTIYMDGKNSRLSVTIVRESVGMVLPIIVTDSKLYTLDPMSMTGVYSSADKSIFTDILSLIGIDKEAASASQNIDRCKITIGGREYSFEHSAGGGFLYETDGSLYAIISDANSLDPAIMIVNEFSENVPDGVFDIPEGYEILEGMETGLDQG